MKPGLVPFPEITTPRLLLRKPTEEDGEAVLFLRSDKEVNKYIKRAKAGSLEDARAFLKRIIRGIENGENFYWGITLKETPELIGSICLWNFSVDKRKAEIGYELDPKYQHQGIMKEALQAVLDFGFGILTLVEIEAYTHYKNKASLTLLEKNGFSLICEKKDPDNEDNMVLAISRPM
ncbi:GNAT family acetyltransferase [Fulvivirga imtechensis AK7]|uniref:GNAT family acetyltransferase n=1 Tax=Fulvivirga imtechensis AK7 TaxID=1237149 RepID=L8JQB0_9BACT|nr:GNAT family N-acetyltransferase [Fulvivirga imtechensis]ELR71040.1 GNAT family acetyltransferase [Fulvivirga imtechensis AK7]